MKNHKPLFIVRSTVYRITPAVLDCVNHLGIGSEDFIGFIDELMNAVNRYFGAASKEDEVEDVRYILHRVVADCVCAFFTEFARDKGEALAPMHTHSTIITVGVEDDIPSGKLLIVVDSRLPCLSGTPDYDLHAVTGSMLH